MASKIKYSPVGNGDQQLMTIEEDKELTFILVDCNIRESCKGTDDDTQFDVKADLLSDLPKRTVNDILGVSSLDVFILTHGDCDHLRGFETNFYQGDPTKFKKSNKDAEEIFIDTLWFTPMVMGSAGSDDEKCFNKEAKRRIKLHTDKSADRDKPGNRILIVGNDASEDLSGLSLVRKVPGNIVTRFNNRDFKTFSVFIHSPYQKQLTDDEIDRNHVSLVFQARFKEKEDSEDFCSLVMFGGDSDHDAWKNILEKTKKHENEHALKWDIFQATHHCSWTFFNDTPQKDNTEPVATSLEVLDYKRGTAKVVASSKEIEDNDDNPPSYAAKKQYVKKVGKDNFFNTETYLKKGNTPQPIVFEVTKQGPMFPKKTEGSAAVAGASNLQPLNKTKEYGSGIV